MLSEGLLRNLRSVMAHCIGFMILYWEVLYGEEVVLCEGFFAGSLSF